MEDQALSPSYDLSPPPPQPSVSSTGDTAGARKTDGGGGDVVGEEPDRTRRESLVLCKLFSTLTSRLYIIHSRLNSAKPGANQRWNS
jgi:hypothetical protein